MSAAPQLHLPDQAAVRDVIDLHEGLERVLNDHDMYARLLARFLKDYGEGMAPVRAMLAADDWDGAHRRIHSLKGASGMLGARAVHAQAAEADKQLLARNANLMRAIDALELAHSDLLQVLRGMVEEPVSALTHAAPADDAVLSQLASLLEGGDGAASDLFEAQAPALQARLGQAQFAALQEAIDNFDFLRARSLLSAY